MIDIGQTVYFPALIEGQATLAKRRPALVSRYARKVVIWLRQISTRMAVGHRRRHAGLVTLPELRDSRIALVKLDGIGDFVLATGLLHLIRDEVSSNKVTLFCTRPTDSLVRREFPEWRIVELGVRSDLWRGGFNWQLRRRLRGYTPFDLLIDLRALRGFADSVVASWIPAVVKVGFSSQDSRSAMHFKGEGNIFDVLVKPGRSHDGDDICDDLANHRKMARFLLPDREEAGQVMPRLHVTNLEKEELSDHLRGTARIDANAPFLLLCPGARHTIREYPVRKLAEVLRGVRQKSAIPIVIAGSADDVRTTQPLAIQLDGVPKVFNLAGRTSLRQHVVLTSMATAVLTMESSTAHIAGALDRPAIVLLGGGHAGIFGPWGQSRRFRWLENRVPCYGCAWECIRDYPECIQDIPPKTIESNLLEVLAEVDAGSTGRC